jgi:hypothetical protein
MIRAAMMAAMLAVLCIAAPAWGQVYGPYNAEFPAGGGGLLQPLPKLSPDAVLPADEPWTISGWIEPSEAPGDAAAIVAGVGTPGAGGRFLLLGRGQVGAWAGGRPVLANADVPVGAWRFLAAVFDGARVRIYLDHAMIAEAVLTPAATPAVATLAPRGVDGFAPYAGRLAGFAMERRALSADDLGRLAAQRPDPRLIAFESGSPHWPVQTHQMFGQITPQPAWTLPRSAAPPTAPTTKPAYAGPALAPSPSGGYALKLWRLASAVGVASDGATISRPGFDVSGWMAATVPGTVLTTMIDRGVYADPEIGLNNLAIPEDLAHHDYWYRTSFDAPPEAGGRHALLTFNGVNYAAEVWLNGERLGSIKGAFIRGRFDVTGRLKAGGGNVLAVQISPPPHPGLAQEESIAAGPGENGGMQALDGPTFIASEGWDWIPSVRDRETGLWQDVDLTFTGDVRLGDPQVVTTLPNSDNSIADVEITVPAVNLSATARRAEVRAQFGDIDVRQSVMLAPGATAVRFDAKDFPSLRLAHPKLWWPNGYGPATLQTLTLSVAVDGGVSDQRRLTFGIRQITYGLSLMDPSGHVRRVDVDFAKARALGQTVLDVRHEAIRKTPGGWVESLTAEGAASPAVTPDRDPGPAPFLVLKVNGVAIAARGGSWGMDDWLKRVEPERLEPYFRLHQQAGLNIIRNWVGQNTEETFYELADKYGLLVLNDFWESTQDYQLEAQDPDLFLANAADVIARFRNHPSIAVWFGRNEGVPQPILNEGLARLTRELDGARWYTPSSNRIELQDSGPYNYRPPADYFTKYAKGFAVEVGSPSFPTKEAFEAVIAPADRWPLSDAWAYHDWHQSGNGAVASFMAAMNQRFGAPGGFDDFERKAQLMNYETYRAIFEGMNAGLWSENSGRLLWMTQPAWPSSEWQIFSHDYDTHAAFYAVKAACEPIHVQMNLATHQVDVVDTSLAPLVGAVVHARVLGLDGTVLSDRSWPASVAADAVGHGPILAVQDDLARQGALIVRLDLTDSEGRALSHNLYWLTGTDADGARLDRMPTQVIKADIVSHSATGLTVSLVNTGSSPALMVKLTLLDGQGRRVLPAYYSDNYVSLLPGERQTVEIRHDAAIVGASVVALRGWNVVPARIDLATAPVPSSGGS